MVKPASIHMVLSIVVSNGWQLRQVNVNNAFLNGELEEDVYMVQLKGYESGDRSMVCKLAKALYGLKPVPRACYTKLHGVFRYLGFQPTKSDVSLFSRFDGSKNLFALVNSNGSVGIALIQTKYIQEILKNANMAVHNLTGQFEPIFKTLIAALIPETTWLKNLLNELCMPLRTPLLIYYDKLRALMLAANPILHSKLKHFEMDLSFVRDSVAKGKVAVRHIRGTV
ncbi:uncharacterized protein [Arachis hypogaea]|uniref:uncharacterized protein n=1 Tax=Arachis hypogaea TaxID=3818 RepID=UPI003B2274C1